MTIYFPRRWLWLWGWQLHKTYIAFHIARVTVMICWSFKI